MPDQLAHAQIKRRSTIFFQPGKHNVTAAAATFPAASPATLHAGCRHSLHCPVPPSAAAASTILPLLLRRCCAFSFDALTAVALVRSLRQQRLAFLPTLYVRISPSTPANRHCVSTETNVPLLVFTNACNGIATRRNGPLPRPDKHLLCAMKTGDMRTFVQQQVGADLEQGIATPPNQATRSVKRTKFALE
ncbi:hypothetical protein FI667_g15158, partial [Globisporangium splendens]